MHGDCFPHEALLDQFGGVDFAKGCYVGQEVVSRMQHRGTARNRIVMVEAADTLPPFSTELLAGGKPGGTVGRLSGREGVGRVRPDRGRGAEEAAAWLDSHRRFWSQQLDSLADYVGSLGEGSDGA